MASFSKTFTIPGRSSDAIYGAVSSDIDRFLSKTPIGNVEVKRDESGRKLTFKSSMASGTLSAKDGSLSVEVSLSLLASAFKGKIEEGITRWLTKTFPS
ncbi:MAG: polyhydroxyalkanoic acid system family protein [Bdellovibrionales bacterium]|nr:polyhydroxyalkanoic acid system family protein [Bdellovibrionales bacterium]